MPPRLHSIDDSKNATGNPTSSHETLITKRHTSELNTAQSNYPWDIGFTSNQGSLKRYKSINVNVEKREHRDSIINSAGIGNFDEYGQSEKIQDEDFAKIGHYRLEASSVVGEDRLSPKVEQ